MSILNRHIDIIRDSIYELKDQCNQYPKPAVKHAQSIDYHFEQLLNILLSNKKESENEIRKSNCSK